jgi:hypothetical protein
MPPLEDARAVFGLPERSTEQCIPLLVPLKLTFTHTLLAGDLPPLHVHLKQRDSGTNAHNSEPDPGAHGPRTGSPGWWLAVAAR